jgi:hypothetical protein
VNLGVVEAYSTGNKTELNGSEKAEFRWLRNWQNPEPTCITVARSTSKAIGKRNERRLRNTQHLRAKNGLELKVKNEKKPGIAACLCHRRSKSGRQSSMSWATPAQKL